MRSRKASAPAPAPELDTAEIARMTEQIEQKITKCLQQVDSSLVNSQYVASGILDKIKVYASHTKKMSNSLRVWGKLWNSFPSAQAPSFAYNTQLSTSLGSSIHMASTASSPQPTMSTPVSGEGFSDMLSKISPPRTTPFHNGRGLGGKDEKSIESLESLRQISPPLTTPFIREKPNKSESLTDMSCQRQLDRDMSMAAPDKKCGGTGESGSSGSPVMSPETQQLVESKRWAVAGASGGGSAGATSDEKNRSRHIRVDSEISIDIGDAGAPLGSGDTNRRARTQPPASAVKAAGFAPAVSRTAQDLDLSKYPSIYQQGLGAKQLQQVYQQFVTENKSLQDPISLGELVERMDNYGPDRLTLLLELLISREYLRTTGKGSKQRYIARSVEECDDDIDLDMSQ